MEFLETWITYYGIWVIFFIIFFESFGLPLPGETILITSSLYATTGNLSILSLIFFSYIAAVAGDCVGYIIGSLGGRKILVRFGYLAKLTPERLEKFEKLMTEKGFYFVATARFFLIARQLNGIISGASKMPFYKFFLANIVGALLWILCWGLGPYFFKNLFI